MLSVLVVEDNNINRDVALLQLRALGLVGEAVTNGLDAVEAVKKKKYLAILMDVMMPEMDGWDACRQIRQYEESVGQRTPIVAVSAWAASDNRKRCLEAGMDDYLSKPYSRDDLKRVLSSWVRVDAKG